MTQKGAVQTERIRKITCSIRAEGAVHSTRTVRDATVGSVSKANGERSDP